MSSVLIKILAGTQRGAELALAPGSYVLGSGDGADVFLADAAVLPRHAVLSAEGDGWLIEPEGNASLTLDGVAVGSRTPVRHYQVLGLGGVHLALGPEGQWDAIPEIPAASTANPPPAPEDRDAQRTPVSTGADGAGGAPETVARPLAPRPPGKRKRSPLPWLLFFFAVAALGAAWWLLWRERDPGGERLASALSALRDSGLPVTDSATDRPAAGVVRLELSPDGRIRLSGLVLTESERAAIPDMCGIDRALLEDALESAEDETARADREVRAAYPGLSVAPERERFSARLEGLAGTASEASEAFRMAREGLDARIALRVGLLIWSEVRRDAESAAARLGVEDAWFERDGGNVVFHSASAPTDRQTRDLDEFLRARYPATVADAFRDALAREQTRRREEEAAAAAMVMQPVPVFPDLDPALRQWALQPLDVYTPPQAPVVEAEAPVAPPQPPEEPPPVEPEPQPEVPPSDPAPSVLLVAEVSPEGFIDQHGVLHRVGSALDGRLRVIRTWEGGVVLQRGRETVLVPANTGISLEE